MPLLELTYKVDWKDTYELNRFFIVGKGVLADLTPLWNKILPTIRSEITQQFSKEGIPNKWTPLSSIYLASYKKKKSRYSMKILKLTGKMWKAATKKGTYGNICSVGKNGIEWGIDLSKIPYARLHDKGGMVRGKKIPQREFLRLTKSGINRIVHRAHKFIRQNIK